MEETEIEETEHLIERVNEKRNGFVINRKLEGNTIRTKLIICFAIILVFGVACICLFIVSIVVVSILETLNGDWCKRGYDGELCEDAICKTNGKRGCGHGHCETPNNCKCEPGYTSNKTGGDCEYVICFDVSAKTPDDQCHGMGECVGPDKCDCNTYYAGESCNLTVCYGRTNLNHSCEDHGDCVSSLPKPVCKCDSGYTGNICEHPICFGIPSDDPKVCSGNGKCVAPNDCECKIPFVEQDCSFRLTDILKIPEGKYNLNLDPVLRTVPKIGKENRTFEIDVVYRPRYNSSIWFELLKKKTHDYSITSVVYSVESVNSQKIPKERVKFVFNNLLNEGKMFVINPRIDEVFGYHVNFTSFIGIDGKVYEDKNGTVFINPHLDIPTGATIIESPKSSFTNTQVFIKQIIVSYPNGKLFNGEDCKSLRKLIIVDDNLVIDNDFAATNLNFPQVFDLDEVIIYAYNVTVKTSVHLAGTNLTIYAQNLIFDDVFNPPGTAKFDLTPGQLKTKPKDFGAPGKKGQNGGNYTLIVQNVLQKYHKKKPGPGKNFIRFISNGAVGQPGADGKEGAGGVNKPVLSSCSGAGHYYDVNNPKIYDYNPKAVGLTTYPEVFQHTIFMHVEYAWCKNYVVGKKCHHEHGYCGDQEFPGDGQKGGNGGKSGDGGDGGFWRLFTNNPALIFTKNWCNVKHGEFSKESSAGKGGIAGLPNPAVIQYGYKHGWGYYHEHWAITSWHSSKKGADGVSQHGVNGKDGVVDFEVVSRKSYPKKLIIDPDYAFFRESVLGIIENHAKQMYSNGHPSETKEFIEPTLKILYGIINNSIADSDTLVRLKTHYNTLNNMKSQIGHSLDYFKKPRGYVQNLNFVSALQLVQKELKYCIQDIYFAEFFNFYWKKGVDEAAHVKKLRDSELSKLQELTNTYNDLLKNLNDLNARFETLQNAKASALKSLQEIKNTLEERAKEEAEVMQRRPIWMKALNLAACVCKVIPIPWVQAAGQIAGLAEQTLEELTKGGWSEDIFADAKKIIDVGDKWANFKIDDNVKKIFDMSSFNTTITNWDSFKKHFNDIHSMAETIQGTVKEVSSILHGQTVSQDLVNKIYEQMVASCQSIKEITQEIKEINEQSTLVHGEIVSVLKDLSNIPNEISQQVIGIISCNERLTELYTLLDPALFNFVQGINQRSRDRYLLYMYYAVKTYTYVLLKQYTGLFNVQSLVDELIVFIAKSKGELVPLTKEDIDACAVVLEDIIRDIIKDFIVEESSEIELSSTIIGGFTGDELKDLNERGSTKIDIRRWFIKDEERLLIRNVKIEKANYTRINESDTCMLTNQLVLVFIHPGKSIIRYKGGIYEFIQYNEDNSIRTRHYISRILFPSEEIINDTPSEAQKELFEYIFNDNVQYSDDEMERYKKTSEYLYRLGAEVEDMTVLAFIPPNMKINELYVRIEYDYLPNDRDEYVVDIKTSSKDIQPYFKIHPGDLSNRTDSIGEDRRIYGNQNVTVVADKYVVGHIFDHFEVRYFYSKMKYPKKYIRMEGTKLSVLVRDWIEIEAFYREQE